MEVLSEQLRLRDIAAEPAGTACHHGAASYHGRIVSWVFYVLWHDQDSVVSVVEAPASASFGNCLFLGLCGSLLSASVATLAGL